MVQSGNAAEPYRRHRRHDPCCGCGLYSVPGAGCGGCGCACAAPPAGLGCGSGGGLGCGSGCCFGCGCGCGCGCGYCSNSGCGRAPLRHSGRARFWSTIAYQRDAAAESLVPGGRRGGDGATEVLRKNTPKKKRPPKAKRSPQPIPPAPMPAPLRLPEPNTGPGTEGQHHAPLSTPPRIFLPKFLPSKASCPASKKATPKGMWKANSAAAVGFGRIFVSEIGTESLSTSGMKLMNCSTKRQRGNA